MNDLNLSLFWKDAGFITIWKYNNEICKGWALHLFPMSSFWCWGKTEEWYAGPLEQIGFGPLFLFIKEKI